MKPITTWDELGKVEAQIRASERLEYRLLVEAAQAIERAGEARVQIAPDLRSALCQALAHVEAWERAEPKRSER